jgi:hypothetical protein
VDAGRLVVLGGCNRPLFEEGCRLELGVTDESTVAESFFGSFKLERIQRRNYQTRLEAQQDVMNYLSVFCHSYRRSCL